MEDASKLLTQKATDFSNTPWGGQPLEIAPFSGDQQSAFQQARDLDPNISTERVVDEGGKLGAISDYMNPYIDQALQPALRKIQEQADAQRKQVGARATSAGAFGDARHGIAEGEVNKNQSIAIGDTAGQFYKSAFDSVMQQRGADLNRFTDVDKTNFSNAITAIQQLLQTGGQQQGLDQAKNQSQLDDFLRKYGHDQDIMAALATAISGAKYSTTTTSTTPGTNPLYQLGGAAIGAMI